MAHKLANETWATILGCILDVPDVDFISCETLSGPFSWHDYSNADVLLVCKLRPWTMYSGKILSLAH